MQSTLVHFSQVGESVPGVIYISYREAWSRYISLDAALCFSKKNFWKLVQQTRSDSYTDMRLHFSIIFALVFFSPNIALKCRTRSFSEKLSPENVTYVQFSWVLYVRIIARVTAYNYLGIGNIYWKFKIYFWDKTAVAQKSQFC